MMKTSLLRFGWLLPALVLGAACASGDTTTGGSTQEQQGAIQGLRVALRGRPAVAQGAAEARAERPAHREARVRAAAQAPAEPPAPLATLAQAEPPAARVQRAREARLVRLSAALPPIAPAPTLRVRSERVRLAFAGWASLPLAPRPTRKSTAIAWCRNATAPETS